MIDLRCPHCGRPAKLPPVVESAPSDMLGGCVRTLCCGRWVRSEIQTVLTKATPAAGQRVIIAGSRHMHPDTYPLIDAAVRKSGFAVTEVVCGMAKGADQLGAKWAYENGVPVQKFPAKWDELGKAAGPVRNAQMAEYADALIVFIWDGSRGSVDMLKKMQLKRKPCFPIYNGEIDYAF